jgi:non-ribosomal peptide synthetase-like protein
MRSKNMDFSESVISKPSPYLVIARSVIEYFRMTVPVAMMTFVFAVTYFLFGKMSLSYSPFLVAALVPLVYVGLLAVSTGAIVGAKWLLLGRFKPGDHPLWSLFIWLNEFITGLHDAFASPMFVEPLRGTPFISLYLRSMGAKIGRGAFIDTTNFTEFDLVEIGENAELNLNCTVQTHLFEDRVFKLSNLKIGHRCSVGPGSIVLYDSIMEEDASLEGLSLLMKSEVLPARTEWEGIPVARREKPATMGSDISHTIQKLEDAA